MPEDPTCNSNKLKDIMQTHMNADTAAAKRNIMKAAEKEFNAKFNVICSKADFSYVAHTNTFCQLTSNEITCYAFRAF